MNKNAGENVDYNNFSKGFSKSRKYMKWEEIDYFLGIIKSENRELSILDVGCGSGRLLGELLNSGLNISDYLGVDLSEGMLYEARSIYPDNNFMQLNMLDLDNLGDKKFNCIFFIASFHHLQNFDYRLKVLKCIYNALEKNGLVFMTNWSLNSGFNYEKYKDCIIKNSENNFGSTDFNIKIGNYDRFYHSFSLLELEELFKKSSFEVIENRLFDSEKNIISIIKKS